MFLHNFRTCQLYLGVSSILPYEVFGKRLAKNRRILRKHVYKVHTPLNDANTKLWLFTFELWIDKTFQFFFKKAFSFKLIRNSVKNVTKGTLLFYATWRLGEFFEGYELFIENILGMKFLPEIFGVHQLLFSKLGNKFGNIYCLKWRHLLSFQWYRVVGSKKMQFE